MPELVAPDLRYQQSFVDAVEEILAGGGNERMAGLSILAAIGNSPEESVTLEQLRGVHQFALYAARLRELADPRTNLPDGIVSATHVWWVEGEKYIGRLSIRHSLTPWLLDYGGHVGYGVRPSARRRGHATAMLAEALPMAKALGIDPVLVTCDADNVASRKVIEACGGVLEDQRGEKLRYWVAASPSNDR